MAGDLRDDIERAFEGEDSSLRDELEVLFREREEIAALDALEYDGIVGVLPDWIPRYFVDKFDSSKERMLLTWRYTPQEAKEWIDRFCRIAEKNDDWFFPAIYPNGLDLEPQHFLDVVGLLAGLRWVVSLGPEEGLKHIGGDGAVLGFKRQGHLTRFAEIHAEQSHDEREKEWQKWRKEASRLIKENSVLSGNKSELARRVKMNLGLSDAVRTIRKRL